MNAAVALCLVAAALAPEPVAIDVTREWAALRVDFELTTDLPEAFEETLPTGAVVRVVFDIQVRLARRMWWDRRLWHGEAVSSAVFDPVTGRYRCELVLDEVIVASREAESVVDARTWLVDPPAVRLALEKGIKRPERASIRVRAVFSSSTKWLVFPSIEGTEWIEERLLDFDEPSLEDTPDPPPATPTPS